MLPDQINQFFSFLYQGRLGEITFWLSFIAGIITSALAAAVIVVLIQFRQLVAGAPAPPPPARPAPMPDIASPWDEVKRRMDSKNPADWNLAVIRADAILDGVLKGMGLPGETMGERLKALNRSQLSSLDQVWEAHHIRNLIAHESDRTINYPEARRAVMLYAQALGELGYLEK